MAPWHLFGHLILGLLVGFFVYWKTKKAKYLIIAFLVSFAIDLDHLFDFWMAYGFNLDVIKFFKIDFFEINQAVYVPLHSWELISIIIILGGVIKKHRWLFLTIGLAMLIHVIWDMISYRIYPQDYFLIYRSLNGFAIRCEP